MSAVTTERPADLTGTQLITLDPREYVAAVYAPFRDRLDAAKAAVANIETVDVSNKDSMAVAIKHRATFRAIRVEAEKARAARKAPVLEIGRLLDSRYREIEGEIRADEDRFDAAIVAEQTRKERERAEREQAERERVAAIQDNLSRLSNAAGTYAGKSSADIATGLERIRAHDVTTWAAEFLPVAQEAHSRAVAALEQLHAGAVAQEQAAAAEAKRAADERAELARLRAESEARAKEEQARAAEAARVAAEETRKRAAEEAAARAKIEAEERASRERIEAAERAARLKREQEEAELQAARQAEAEKLAAERKVVEDRARAVAEQERAAREKQEAEARALAEQQRQAREREEAAQREIERQQNELLDGDAMLAKFVERFGKRKEFAGVVKAINAHLAPAKVAA